MTDWRPTGDVGAARRRAALLARIREYFLCRDVLAVDTPALGATTVTDPNIESFAVGSAGWLQTSPEYFMKRLLAAGYPDIYAIARVFREGEVGRRNLAEFTLVEWYRRDFGLDDIIHDTLDLAAHALAGKCTEPAEIIDYAEALQRHAGVGAFDAPVAELARAAGADSRLLTALNEDRDAWLNLLMATVVTPRFPAGRLTVIRHYPASQAALARRCPSDPAVADRFELFAGELELANGYVELTDPAELAARMGAELAARRRRMQSAVPRDHRLLAAFAAGLPACAGVALGLERLQMLADGTDDIKNVVTFAVES